MNISFKNKKQLPFDKLIQVENKIYLTQQIKNYDIIKSIDIEDIKKRRTRSFYEKDFNIPQNIFLLTSFRGYVIFGRKIRSILNIEKKINAINCSMITASMLLGIFKEKYKINRTIKVSYYPLYDEEKIYIFNEIKKDRNIDISFPYTYKNFYTNKEKICSESGWSFNYKKKKYLGYGEHHIRKFTIDFFKDYDFRLKKIIYDPACSTGEFLKNFKKNFPNSYTIGHDLSKEMINHAKNYVNEYFCCNALNSPLKPNSVDIMFLRFLNSEIVSTKMAYKIMRVLLKKIKIGGLIVCFGHTPVLLKKPWFKKLKLKILNCNGYDKSRDAIFQYYVLQVTKTTLL
ncbi:MAG: methyltransferase domain-containing protein [Bdellovibrionota bacterium]